MSNTKTACSHDSARWELDPHNEAGWSCEDCGKLGFRPDLDAEYVYEKVDGILFWLAHHDIISVSNSTTGEVIAANVSKAAAKVGRYDQYTLIGLILSDPNLAGHADYWAKEAETWLRAEREGKGHEKPVDQQLRAAGVASLFGEAF